MDARRYSTGASDEYRRQDGLGVKILSTGRTGMKILGTDGPGVKNIGNYLRFAQR